MADDKAIAVSRVEIGVKGEVVAMVIRLSDSDRHLYMALTIEGAKGLGKMLAEAAEMARKG